MNTTTHKKILSLLLCAVMICICIPQSIAFADGTINDNDTHSFTGDTTPIVIEGGNPTIVLTDVTINASNTPSIRIKAGASVTLQLNGDNILNGGKGCAAICVDPAYDTEENYSADNSAKLTILGSGNLTAIGGDSDEKFGAGAGIGGNGQNFDNDMGGVDFGTVEILQSFTGTVSAKGGEAIEPPNAYNGDYFGFGGGAGIGSGGFDCGNYYWETVYGKIDICGGTINANEESNDKYVGAGIGGGRGGLYNAYETNASEITVTIKGGTVTAQGGVLSAGIGGGSLCDGGTINISGGKVTANAGDPDGASGASGIGGGDNSGVYKVNITGGTVTATASGGAAGIGGGTNTSYSMVQYEDVNGARTEGKIGVINISGYNTVVTAFGGTGQGYSGKYGGAGIGSGYPVNDVRSVAFDISIKDGATVNAYGGYHSQAIGYGYRPGYYRGYGIKLNLDDTISLFALNSDYFQPPLVDYTTYDESPISYESNNTYLVVYKNTDGSKTEADSNTATAYLKYPTKNSQNAISESFEWSYTDEKLIVDGNELKTLNELNGSWATLCKKKTGALSVSKTVTGNAGDTTKDFNFTVTLNDDTISGTYGDVIFENGVGAFTLRHNQTKTAAGLPTDITYTVVETEANQDGYTTTATGDTGTIADSETAIAEFTNNKSKNTGGGSSSSYGTLKIVKTDFSDEKTPLADATFEIYDISNKLIGTYTTDESGQITINKLAKGNYYAIETVAPNGYETDSEKYSFTVNARKTTTLNITNKKKDASEYKPSDKGEVPDILNGTDHFAYIVGREVGLVYPEAPITRAEVTTIFFRLLKPEIRSANLSQTNMFADVQESDWHNIAVSTMSKLGIIKGRTKTEFVPNAFITRAEFAAIATRFDESDVSDFADFTDFTDIVNHWARGEIIKAAAKGWVKGYEDGTFRPDDSITRAEAMALINRVLNRMPETTEDLLGDMVKWSDNADESEWYYLDVQEATNSHNYELKHDGVHEKWTSLTENPDWINLND